eukprot:TRINITY_DN9656_c0_g1_i1.p1 TRINITY_DN9656_c0_g1~~TRINITY_DN9656_c0_g1_i1.p1  ORF type:complete len:138 (+),score=18.99 TRINITY_DN9656_c0_g1_i1:3-416(+)
MKGVYPPKHVLIVEDNPVNQKVLSRHLKGAGHTFFVASNGKEAIDKVETGEIFDVILMDIQMPVMNGLESTQLIRARETKLGLPTVPIVGLSGNATKEDMQRAREAGMMDFIPKPYQKEDLFRRMNTYAKLSPQKPS